MFMASMSVTLIGNAKGVFERFRSQKEIRCLGIMNPATMVQEDV